ncbi:MAG: cysteine hydrolase family protein [Inhella sp.]
MSGDALLVIDTQRGAFDAGLVGEWAMPNGDALIAACKQAVAWARRTGAAVIWVQHHEADGPMNGDGFAIDPRLAPAASEPRILKTEPSSFSNTALTPLLAGKSRVLLAGLQSDCCVRATALAGQAAGVPVAVIADAHQTWPSDGRSASQVRDAINTELAAAGIPLLQLADL